MNNFEFAVIKSISEDNIYIQQNKRMHCQKPKELRKINKIMFGSYFRFHYPRFHDSCFLNNSCNQLLFQQKFRDMIEIKSSIYIFEINCWNFN